MKVLILVSGTDACQEHRVVQERQIQIFIAIYVIITVIVLIEYN